MPGISDVDLRRVVGKPHAVLLLPKLNDIAMMVPAIMPVQQSSLKKERKFNLQEARDLRQTSHLIDGLFKGIARLAQFVRYDDEYDALALEVDAFGVLLQDLRGRVGTRLAVTHGKTLKRRGRVSAAQRHPMALLVGRALKGAGVRLTKSVDGKYAKVLSLTYEAAGITVPADLFRDVERALADKRMALRANLPSRASR